MTDPDTRLAEILARLDNSTAGPWTAHPPGGLHDGPWIGAPGPGTRSGVFVAECANHPDGLDDVGFIVEARADVPWLVDQLTEVKATLDATIDQFEQYVADGDHTRVVAQALASRDRLGRALLAAEAERDRLAAAVQRVRQLHNGHRNREHKCVCMDCLADTGVHFPARCATLRALDGEVTGDV